MFLPVQKSLQLGFAAPPLASLKNLSNSSIYQNQSLLASFLLNLSIGSLFFESGENKRRT